MNDDILPVSLWFSGRLFIEDFHLFTTLGALTLLLVFKYI